MERQLSPGHRTNDNSVCKCAKASLCFCRQGDPGHSDKWERGRLKCCVALTFGVFVTGVIHLGYFCPDRICAFSSGTVMPTVTNSDSEFLKATDGLRVAAAVTANSQSSQKLACDGDSRSQVNIYTTQGQIMHQNFSAKDLDRDYRFDIDNDKDVIVFLHIQKTGGTTFGRHLIKNLKISKPCRCHRGKKKCDCQNHSDHVWLFSRYSTGWRCGLHADWTELTSCVNGMLDKIENEVRYRRFLYITVLRDPYKRYLSEYKHVQRGATWKSARLQCDGQQASLEEVPFCFEGENWEGVTLGEFIDCPHNLANNRQTRMMANLSLSGCYDKHAMSEHDRYCTMLRSAKQNLRKMAFFGLTEYQHETQHMFEKVFGLNFIEDFFQYNRTHANEVGISKEQQRKILELNNMDVELYQYAKELFFQRLEKMRANDALTQNKGYSPGKDQQTDTHSSDDYLEANENFADDDDSYNERISKDETSNVKKRQIKQILKHKSHRADKTRHRGRRNV